MTLISARRLSIALLCIVASVIALARRQDDRARAALQVASSNVG
jgi:hypothetical protein